MLRPDSITPLRGPIGIELIRLHAVPRELGAARLLLFWPDSLVPVRRDPLGVQNTPARIIELLIFLFPESPRWFIDNKTEEGLEILANLHAYSN